MAIVGSSSQLHGFPAYASQMPDPLLGRSIDCFTQCLQVGSYLSMLRVSHFDLADHFSFLVSDGD